MSALPRPDIAGPARSLNDALHDLHHRAGWPSLRTLARQTGVSHTTVSKTFSAPVVPSWGTVELLVEVLGGDTATFHDLWLLASRSANTPSALPVTSIAGRRHELTALRRHLQTGNGLMLVAGEAGIGKTRVVTTAVQTGDFFVAIGHCLPLSMQVPLMPIADLLRAIHDADHGQRLKEVLSVAPPYVRASLAGLLPELLEEGLALEDSDEFSRQRLLAALSKCVTQMHSTFGLGLLVEDLHWADTATLDVLEHLVVSGVEVPIVGTWRQDDPDTGDPQRDWWFRVRRFSTVETLDLAPLTREETGDQCRLLGIRLNQDSIDEIHHRSGGQPLFTELLAAQAGADTDLPVILADLLDCRLDLLDESAQVITRALGVADRGLASPILAAVTGLDESSLTHGLRELTRRQLLAGAGRSAYVQLKHPLLAEAVRRRLVAGEAAAIHRLMAIVLSNHPGSNAAEIAEHWRGAGDPEQELAWRIAAARAAGARWAARQEAELWLRVLQLWPAPTALAGDPPLTRAQAYLAAVDALMHSLQFDRAAAMSDHAAAEFPVLEPGLRAEFLRRAAHFRADLDGPEVGLKLIDEAIELLSLLPPDVGMVQAMVRKHQLLLKGGRYAEAFNVARETVVAAEAVGDRQVLRVMLGRVAWHEAVTGGLEQGAATMARARSLLPSVEDPTGDIWLAVIWTDVLLILGASSTEVQTAGQHALALAEEQGIEDFGPVLVRYNITSALIHDGRLEEADALLGPETEREVDLDRAPIFEARALLDALGGHLNEAARTIEILQHDNAGPNSDLENVSTAATIELWRNRPKEAWSRAHHALATQSDSTPAALLLPTLVLAARAAADLAISGTADAAHLLPQLLELRGRADRGRSVQGWATARALDQTWSAELARLEGKDSMRLWLDAASEWSSLRRPHDAAYCRWRAAQVALRTDQGTVGARLLKRAATDARGHVPLLAAIKAARPN